MEEEQTIVNLMFTAAGKKQSELERRAGYWAVLYYLENREQILNDFPNSKALSLR